MARRENVTSESQTNDNGARLGNQTNFSDILLFTRSYRALEVFFFVNFFLVRVMIMMMMIIIKYTNNFYADEIRQRKSIIIITLSLEWRLTLIGKRTLHSEPFLFRWENMHSVRLVGDKMSRWATPRDYCDKSHCELRVLISENVCLSSTDVW